MIRLTVEQLYLLEKSIQGSGQANTSVLPLEAMGSHRLIIAWAKTRTGSGLYLSVWKDQNSWREAIEKDRAGAPLPYDFLNDQQSAEYTHVYPVDGKTVDEGLYRTVVTATGRIKYTNDYVPGAADSGHPEFGVSFDN